ncbi:hypothetical protein ACFL34_06120 [Candidatus Sumerlaeota bacterium]
MNRSNVGALASKTWLVGLVVMVMAQFTTQNAAGQRPGGRGEGLSAEKQQAAHELQARGVAHTLKLNDEATSKIVVAYQKARASHQKAQAAIRADESIERSDRRSKYQDLLEVERKKLDTELQGFLKKEQAAQALASLGAFNRSWDRMVGTLSGFKLEKEKQFKALELLNGYVIETGKLAAAARASGDRQGVREATAEKKQKLDAGLEKILDATQLGKWKEATAPRQRGR